MMNLLEAELTPDLVGQWPNILTHCLNVDLLG